MSLISKNGFLRRIQRGRKARAQMVSSNLSEGIAFQIRATRDKRVMTQAALARESGMTQNNLSRVESPDYGKQTISSLKRIAEALDVALVVRFVPFSQYINWLSGTPFLDEGLRPEALAVPSFEDEEKNGQFNSGVRYFPIFTSATVTTAMGVDIGVSGSYSSQNIFAYGDYSIHQESRAS
jgi:transcriptional regulator with XRE-family HTH domain